jgi:hypothetical protein
MTSLSAEDEVSGGQAGVNSVYLQCRVKELTFGQRKDEQHTSNPIPTHVSINPCLVDFFQDFLYGKVRLF